MTNKVMKMNDKNIKRIITFVLFFISFNLSLFSYKLEVHDCKGEIIEPGKNALAKDVKNALDNAMEKAKTCLPEGFYNKIKNKLDSVTLIIHISCHMPGKCGETWQFKDPRFKWSISFSYQNNWKNGCGCLEGIMIHELLHWGGELTNSDEDETKAYSCQLKCYSECTKIPKEYKDKAKPELCCESEK